MDELNRNKRVLCTGTDPNHCDDLNCCVHGKNKPMYFCQVCNQNHDLDQFEHIGGGSSRVLGGRELNWITLRCLMTDEIFQEQWFEDLVEVGE